MSLMRLAPECVRLRRMARAWAAGEMTQSEYRRARRELIDGFPSAVPVDDDTQPRFLDEPTLRSDSRFTGQLSVTVETEEAAQSDRRWLWLAGLILVLAAAILTLPEVAAAPGDAVAPGDAAARGDAAAPRVPPVRERTPDPLTSPRLPIDGVRVAWGDAAAAPATGAAPVSLDLLQRRADDALAAIRESNAPRSHGFTRAELEEVARYLDVLGVHRGDAGLDAADAADLSALIRDQKRRRGVSVAQLETVAAAVQEGLREAGLFLGVAYVPAQTVDDGIARIEVLPGRLGDIVVEGGDPGPVSDTFAPLLGQPLTLAAVSRRLQVLNGLPGLKAQASFGPGAAVGESELRLDLLEQRRWTGSVALDNHGDDATGDQRLSVGGAWLNPRGVGDRLSAGLLTTVNPSNQTYGYLAYDMPAGADYRLSARIGNNDFSRDRVPALDGGGWFVDVAARRHLLHSRERALALVLGGARQRLDYDDGVAQTVTTLSAGLAGHRVWDEPRIAADAGVNLQWGWIGGDTFPGQEDGFWLLEADSEAWMPVSLPWLDGEQKLRGYLSGQWSDARLPATRRFALGGAARGRAFDRSLFLADRAGMMGLEVRVPVGLGELLVFTEAGYGVALGDGGERWVRIVDAGLGWDAELGQGISSRLSWARPLDADGSPGVDGDDDRWYWSLRYEH